MSTLVLEPPAAATAKQLELARAFHGPAKHILASGAVRSGKTQAAARLLVESAITHPCLYVVARQTYGELKDSTQHAMLDGDGSLPPLIPNEVRDHTYGTRGYHTLDNAVRLVNGAEIRFRNLEKAHTWLNTAYGAIMIDQAEEMDGGLEGERLVDAISTRLSDPRGPRKIIFVANPAGTTHWLYRRFVSPESRWPTHAWVHFTLLDNAQNLPADLIDDLEGTRERRPHFYRAMVLGEWGAFEGAAYPELSRALHVACPEEIPNEWRRLEGMDHGTASHTAWLAASVDYDGNLVVFDEYYERGFIDEHAKEVTRRRQVDWRARDDNNEVVHSTCYADPSIKNRWGARDVKGTERSVEAEYLEHGISFAPGQNDRRAGYARIRELLHPDQERPFPNWHPRYGEKGSPRIFLSTLCGNTLEQLQDAPVKAEGKDSLDVVDPDWEHVHGHAHAALRYLCLGHLRPSEPPDENAKPPDDPAAYQQWLRDTRVAEETARMDDPDVWEELRRGDPEYYGAGVW